MENLNFSFQLDEFMLFCRSRQLREKTMNSYEQTLRLFERWCWERFQIENVDQITESVVRRYINDLMERGKYSFYTDDKRKTINYPERRRDFRNPISITTINNYIRNLRVFFNWLDRDYLLPKNPMKKIRQLKNNRKAKEYISDEDFKRLIGLLDKSYFSEHRDFVMIILMIDTGMRLGECSLLLVEDVNLAKKQVFLRAENTKGRKDRIVFFSPKTETILRRWLQFKDRYAESDYLFPVKYSGAAIGVSNFETNFKKYLKRAALNESISPHCLRNNFAKRCLMNGMDIFTLSKILGHSSVRVTEEAYLDLNSDDIQKRYQNFSPMATIK
ncbi:MAG: site-specific integrase [Ruminococcaceae bacterium]|nr:site-specific integrase [Oscillospiraceae bacterium]